MAKEKYKFSSRAARMAAYIVDVLILLPVTLFVRVFGIPFLGLIVAFGYHWIAISLYGRTLGHKLFGLRVISSDDSKISWGKAFLREFVGKFVSAIVLCLGFIWILFDDKRQGWHDKLAHTYVIQEEPLEGAKKIIAYILASVFPILFVLAIVIGVLLVVINPAAQIKKARELQQQRQYIQQYNQLQNQNQYLPTN